MRAGSSPMRPLFTIATTLIVCLATPSSAQTGAAGQHWIATWGTAQQQARIPAQPPAQRGQAPAPAAPALPPAPAPGAPARRFGIPPPIAGIHDQTVRMIVRTSVGGKSVRVRLSNAFGAAAVSIGAAHLALRQSESGIVTTSDRVLTFSGRPTATMYAGQVLISDPVSLAVPPLSDVAISLYVANDAGVPTGHTFGLRPTYVSSTGDFTGAATIETVTTTTQSYYWLTGVDVLAPAAAATLVTFGDSITDGDQSTPDTLQMWPAMLAARLQANPATRDIGVVNAGISGNRVLGDNNSGLARFQRDALSVPGVRWITLLEGINDISGATRQGDATGFGADDLIAAYRQMIELAHQRDVAVIGCTITPYGGSSAFRERGEQIRMAVNDWIRKSGAFDAVIDFDAATRDPADPQRFRAPADSPDLLHPGDAGYKLMADAVDLRIFQRVRRRRSAKSRRNSSRQRLTVLAPA